MKGKIIRVAALFIFVVLFVCFGLDKKTYASPKEYCQSWKFENYLIAEGDHSAFILYEQSPGKYKEAFLKRTEKGFVSTGFRLVKKELAPPYFAEIYKGSSLQDHYIIFSLSEEHDQVMIEDARGSTFLYNSFYLSTSEQTEIGSFVVAFIGTESDDYYKHEYWYKVSDLAS